MAKRRDIDADPAPQEAVEASTLVRIVNLTPYARDIHLTNGRCIRVGPRLGGETIHISEPIPRKLLGQFVRRLEAMKRIQIVTEEG